MYENEVRKVLASSTLACGASSSTRPCPVPGGGRRGSHRMSFSHARRRGPPPIDGDEAPLRQVNELIDQAQAFARAEEARRAEEVRQKALRDAQRPVLTLGPLQPRERAWRPPRGPRTSLAARPGASPPRQPDINRGRSVG